MLTLMQCFPFEMFFFLYSWLQFYIILSVNGTPQREFWLRNGTGKTCLWKKNIFFSTNKDKIGEEIIFEIVHCPFEG